MKKKNSSKYDYLINEYPAVITKDQFYRICNISKKTAKHLLDNGLVPCINSGKKTRKYKLKLTDVIVYLEARDVSPEIYTAPLGWYKRGSTYKGHKREPRVLTEEERDQLTKCVWQVGIQPARQRKSNHFGSEIQPPYCSAIALSNVANGNSAHHA